jgi:hypothetical protein
VCPSMCGEAGATASGQPPVVCRTGGRLACTGVRLREEGAEGCAVPGLVRLESRPGVVRRRTGACLARPGVRVREEGEWGRAWRPRSVQTWAAASGQWIVGGEARRFCWSSSERGGSGGQVCPSRNGEARASAGGLRPVSCRTGSWMAGARVRVRGEGAGSKSAFPREARREPRPLTRVRWVVESEVGWLVRAFE